MGLGGLTRDSIIGLNNLVHDDDDQPSHIRRHSGGNSLGGSWNSGSKNKDSNEFLFLEEEQALPMSESQGSFETSLNDGAKAADSSGAAMASARSPGAYSKVSATNSRSLDSYRSNAPSNSYGENTAQAAHYQGFQYEGYTDYYSEDYASYGYDDHSHSAGSKSGEKKNVFCCLFAPWMQPKVIISEDQSVMSGLEEQDQAKHEEEITSPDNKTNLNSSAPSPENVATSPVLSPTESLREKIPHAKSLGSGFMPTPTLSSEDNAGSESSQMPNLPANAITPKLATSTNEPSVKFAAPPSAEKVPTPQLPHMLSDDASSASTVFSTSPKTSYFSDEKKQDEGDLALDKQKECADPPRIKGILKVKRCSASSYPNSNNRKKSDNESTSSSSSSKRHLFPTYEHKNSPSNDKSINFNPMARVLTIPSRKDIPLHQKAQVWWQKCDYDEFKKTGRIISKAMECGGSEIWLASSNAWGNRAARSKKVAVEERRTNHSEEYNKALSKYVSEEKKDEEESSGDFGTKWWCKFGHSRRGIEHIADSSEGKARQQSVVLAIRMVMEEQKRQRIHRTKDPNKLRNVAMQYTSWARDLSLAAGAADAEAVASNFDPAAASRAHHFAKSMNKKLNHSDVGGGVAMAVTSQILDANAHYTPSTRSKTTNHVQSEESLSKRAKGFIPGI